MIMGARRRSYPDFSPSSKTNYEAEDEYEESEIINNVSSMVSRKRDSTGSCPAWSVNSFIAAVPSSPSPKCSPCSLSYTVISGSPSSTDIYYSQISSQMSVTDFGTPRNMSSCAFSNDGKESESSEEKEEEVKDCDVADLRSLYQPRSEIIDFKEGEGVNEVNSPKRLSFSSSDYRSIDSRQPLLGVPLLAVTEELVKEENYSGSSVNDGDIEPFSKSPIYGNHRVMARPKPYHAFLYDIKKKEIEDKFNIWKEAQHLKLMSKLRKKEAIINAWELRMTKLATLEMKRIENKLERKRAKAFDKMEMKISKAQRKAEEKKKRERRSTVNKIEMVTRVTEKIRFTKNSFWFKLLSFW